MLGRLVRFIDNVQIFVRYICIGLLFFVLRFYVIVGDVGFMIMLQDLNVFWKLFVMMWWIFCVCRQYVLQQLCDSIYVLIRIWCFILGLKFLVCDFLYMLSRLLYCVVWWLKCMLLKCDRFDDVFVGVIMQYMGIDSFVFGSDIGMSVVLSVLYCLSVVLIVVCMLLVRLVLKYLFGKLMCRLVSGLFVLLLVVYGCLRWCVKFLLLCLRFVELCLLKLVIVFSSSVQLDVFCVIGLFWLSDDVNVIILQCDMWLQVGLMFVMFVNDVGWWIELLVLVLVVVGVRCVVMVVELLFELLFGIVFVFYGFFIVLNVEFLFDEFIVNLFMLVLLSVIMLVVCRWVMMVVLNGFL